MAGELAGELAGVGGVHAHASSVSQCLYSLSSFPEALEGIANLPPLVCDRLVGLALCHVSGGQDPARKNAALFLAEAIKVSNISAQDFHTHSRVCRLLYCTLFNGAPFPL